jgi:hypothetical protein
MKNILFPLLILTISCFNSLAGDTLSINNAYFTDPVADGLTIDINKTKIDQSFITIETDGDENEIRSIVVDYQIIFINSDTINGNDVVLYENRSNEVFQIILSDVVLKKEKQPITISLTIKKDGLSKNYHRDDLSLFYIHNYLRIDSIVQAGARYNHIVRDTIYGFNNNRFKLYYSVNLNTVDLGIVDFVTNPFYSRIEGVAVAGNSKKDTLILFDNDATDDKNLKFSQNIELKEGFNRLLYTIYDTDKDWPFKDSILFFYIKIDEDQQKVFCKSDPITKLTGLPEGGSFRFAENSVGLQSGLIGNTNVFNPALTSEGLPSFAVEYCYRFRHGQKVYNFSDSMQIRVNGLPPDFAIEGKTEVCAFEEDVEYKVISRNTDFNPSDYLITWNVNGENLPGDGSLHTINWQNKTNSEITVEIANSTTGCSVTKHKFVKVGSNEIPSGTADIATPRIDKEKNNILIYSNTAKNVNQYLWSLPNGKDTTTTVNYLLTDIVYGNYTLQTAYNGNPGCYSKPASLLIDESMASASNQVMIYPNPFAEKLFIDTQEEFINSQGLTFILKNQSGNRITSGYKSGKEFEIDCSSLQAGIYILTISDGTKTINRKIVKK